MIEKKRVAITGFGSWSTRTSKPRKGKNPYSGDDIHIPAKERLRFKASAALKTAVDTGVKPVKKVATKKSKTKKEE